MRKLPTPQESQLNPQRKPQSKTGKKQKNLYLSDQARQLLANFARDMGISETAVVELMIREKAAKESMVLAASDEAKERSK